MCILYQEKKKIKQKGKYFKNQNNPFPLDFYISGSNLFSVRQLLGEVP